MFIVCTFLLVLNMIFHVDTKTMVDRTGEMSKISANIFDFTARKFFRREDLSIFIDHMINYQGSTQPLFLL